MNPFINKHCRDYARHESPLSVDEIENNLIHTPDWEYSTNKGILSRRYGFMNYVETIQFVNKVAQIATEQDHHPIMEVGYSHCRVSYNTHTVNGITDNDFICAVKIDAAADA